MISSYFVSVTEERLEEQSFYSIRGDVTGVIAKSCHQQTPFTPTGMSQCCLVYLFISEHLCIGIVCMEDHLSHQLKTVASSHARIALQSCKHCL